MVARFVAALEPAVSKVRLEAYRPAGADALDMAVNYFLNIELSEALYPSLQAFELALRNSIHAALSKHFQAEFWFDQPGFLLTWQQGAIQNARDELTKYGKPHDAGRIVAELNFGFWHSMFNRPYEAVLWHANGAVLLDEVFPPYVNPSLSPSPIVFFSLVKRMMLLMSTNGRPIGIAVASVNGEPCLLKHRKQVELKGTMVESRSLELFDEIAVWIVEVGKHFSDHRSSGCFVERIPEIFELLVQSTIWIHGAQEVGFGCHGSLSLP